MFELVENPHSDTTKDLNLLDIWQAWSEASEAQLAADKKQFVEWLESKKNVKTGDIRCLVSFELQENSLLDRLTDELQQEV